MNLPDVVIWDDDKIIDIEGRAINDICYSLKEEFPNYSGNELKYHSYIYLNFPKEVGKPIDGDIEFSMKKDTENDVMIGKLDNIELPYLQLIKGQIKINSKDELGGNIEITYNGVHFTGDITGKTLTGGFSAMFTCSSVLHSDDNSMEFHLKFDCINDITQKCSAAGICNTISDILGNKNELHYDKYIAGWKKIGQAYRYISPQMHDTLKYCENPSLSTEVLKSILKYIDNDLGMLIFAHCLQSIVMSIMKPANHSILNIECSTHDRNKYETYISSIVHSFWKPNISVNNRNVSNFVLNRKFKVSSCMANIGKLKKDSRLFRDFPVFLHGKYIKRDIYSDSPAPLPSLKTQITNANIRHMFKSDLSFICFNADNHVSGIVNFTQNKSVELTDEKLINDTLYKLIQEYIAFLEEQINHTLYLSSKNRKLIETYYELFYEFKFNIFKEFLSELKATIRELAKNRFRNDEFIILCRHMNYSDVLELFKNIRQCSESFSSASNFINWAKMNKYFESFTRDIMDRSKRNLSSTDYHYLERAEICGRYLKKLNNELECDSSHTIFKGDYDSLNENLTKKCKLYRKQYRERLIIRFAGSMKYNVKMFDEWSYYAKNAMKKHKQECTKPTRKYCEGLLAATYGFTLFLRERYGIGDTVCSYILDRVENMYQYLYSADEVKPLDEELKVKLFCSFLDDCRRMSADVIGSKMGLNPIYTEADLLNYDGSDKKDSMQLIGWYDTEKFEYILIKKEQNSPVETAFKKFLKKENYENDFVWSTFVSTQLYPKDIVKGTKMSGKKCCRYDYKKTIDGQKYTVYYMYV